MSRMERRGRHGSWLDPLAPVLQGVPRGSPSEQEPGRELYQGLNGPRGKEEALQQESEELLKR